MKQKTGIVIQARMNSERLPGKVLMNLPHDSEETILSQIIKRSKKVGLAHEVVVASTTNHGDDRLEDYLKSYDVKVFRGEEHNVLQRFYDAATQYKLDHIVRLTGDNPFIVVDCISEVIEKHLESSVDYSYTTGLPLGTNLEVISYQALEKAHKKASRSLEREHVTPFIRQHPGQFRILKIALHEFDEISKLRLTIDTEEDYALACLLYRDLAQEDQVFGFAAIQDYYGKNPWLDLINQHIIQRKASIN